MDRNGQIHTDQMTMISLQSFIEYLARLLYRRQMIERQITAQKMGASLLLLTKLRFEQEARKGWLSPPLNPPRCGGYTISSTCRTLDMARPKKTDAPLDKVIGVRVNSDTLSKWIALARASGLTIGEWARNMIQNNKKTLPTLRRPPPPAVDPKLLAAVGRIGNNLNQIARAANRNRLPGQRDLLARLIDIERKLDEVLWHDD